MDVPSVSDALPSRSAVVLVAALAVSVAIFVPTAMAYASFDKVKEAELSVEDVSIDDGETVVIEMTVENPTWRSLTVTGIEPSVRTNGTLVNDLVLAEFEKRTIPPGETRTITVRTPLLDGNADRTRAADRIDSATVFARVEVEIGGEQRIITLDRTGVR